MINSLVAVPNAVDTTILFPNNKYYKLIQIFIFIFGINSNHWLWIVNGSGLGCLFSCYCNFGPCISFANFFVFYEYILSSLSGMSSMWFNSFPIKFIVSALYLTGSCIWECHMTSWHFDGTVIAPFFCI